ncbi:hypothetical protein Tsubulata_045022 [Turnera subulata]|uniref:C3H1-type domain-containing protein n=1 Tax=Turnera subulata TaxID=218843 RepID=A0A9Q0GDL7_9ROSI|nr:hypothetical protein Tsubulata_045022 [Turnera subulata]
MAPPRILLCGDVLGRLNQLFKRVQSVNKSAGPFDALLCVGQFFPDSPDLLDEFTDYMEGRSQVPLPTYFIGDYGVASTKFLSAAARNSASLGFKMDGIKVCENLYWLRGSGKFVLHGLSVAYLAGRQLAGNQQFGKYSQDDVDALRALAEEPGVVDLFLSYPLPLLVSLLNMLYELSCYIPKGISDTVGSDSTVAELVAEIKPRYHIAGTKGVFYAREPYSNVDAVHVTRFLGLAPVGNKDKQKFIHAISPPPASTMSAAEIGSKPPGTTLSPYTIVEKASHPKEVTKRPGDSASDSQYWRYDVSNKRQKAGAGDSEKLCFKFIYSGSCPREEKCNFRHDMDAREQYLRGVCLDFLIKGKCERGPDCSFKHQFQNEEETAPQKRRGSNNANANRSKECWFCLSSPNVESHLIVTVGEHYYCALPKGPLVQDHVLMIPVEHSANTLSLPEECETELDRFSQSLKLYMKKQGKDAILFEWASKRGTHANLQVVPVPSSKAAAVQNICKLAADRLGFEFVATKSNSFSEGRKWLRSQFDRNNSFFYMQLPDYTVLSHAVEENERFPAQFGREVMAGLMNIPEKADWKNCVVSKEEETRMAEEFRKQFEELDPTQ